jgi:hypothetical protein
VDCQSGRHTFFLYIRRSLPRSSSIPSPLLDCMIILLLVAPPGTDLFAAGSVCKRCGSSSDCILPPQLTASSSAKQAMERTGMHHLLSVVALLLSAVLRSESSRELRQRTEEATQLPAGRPATTAEMPTVPESSSGARVQAPDRVPADRILSITGWGWSRRCVPLFHPR